MLTNLETVSQFEVFIKRGIQTVRIFFVLRLGKIFEASGVVSLYCLERKEFHTGSFIAVYSYVHNIQSLANVHMVREFTSVVCPIRHAEPFAMATSTST